MSAQRMMLTFTKEQCLEVRYVFKGAPIVNIQIHLMGNYTVNSLLTTTLLSDYFL